MKNIYHPYCIYYDNAEHVWSIKLADNGLQVKSCINKNECISIIKSLQSDMEHDIS